VDPSDSHLAVAVATVQAFLGGVGALRAVLLLDRGSEPVVIDLDATGELEIARGEDVAAVQPGAFAGAQPLALPELHSLRGVEVDADEGVVTAPIGILQRAGDEVRAAARLFGERSVLTVAYATSDPDAPLFVAARGEEPLVISLGGREWELP
jgi:hypothetical protein